MRALRDSPVVARPGELRPLVLDDAGRLYLYRYWEYEKRLAEDLLTRALAPVEIDDALLRAGLAQYFPNSADVEQKLAAATAVLRRFCVISGGPGTGKTTTLVKILALLAEQAHNRNLAIGLAAPTGKAAARVQEAVRTALGKLPLDLFVRETVPQHASTLHRLLGARPDSVYPRHHRGNPLALDVLVVDEASMADLALAAKLVDALPQHARLIFLGDKDQLASVEAGAVLGDVCARSGMSPSFAKRVSTVSGVPVGKMGAVAKQGATALSESVALLHRSYRFGPESGIGTLARLVNEGRGDEALALLGSGKHGDIAWRTMGARELTAALAKVAAERVLPFMSLVRSHAPAEEIFDRFDDFRMLCAHRNGADGVIAVNRVIEDLLREHGFVHAREKWYAGRPVMVTRNDYNLQLFNGDVGIALPDTAAGGALKVHFPASDGRVRAFAPARLPEHETVFAMTIHKSQGSEFGHVLMILPREPSPVTSRELVYTGITRAKRGVEIWGTEGPFREAIARRVVRASALRERLWSADADR
jgi:exodeoxyribonuclease V alpha subunit